MPVNLSLNSTTTEHQQAFKYGAENLTGDSRGGDGKGGGNVPLALVKTEGQASMLHSFSGGTCQKESREQIRRLYEQSSYDLSLAGYLRDDQRSSPDSTYEEPVEKEVRHNLSTTMFSPYTWHKLFPVFCLLICMLNSIYFHRCPTKALPRQLMNFTLVYQRKLKTWWNCKKFD